MEQENANIFYNRRLHTLLLILIGIAIYANSLHAPFTFDDKPNIVENYALKGLANFIDVSNGNLEYLDDRLSQQFQTRIVGYLSFALNYYFYGLSVFGYHAFNLSIHLLNALLVYLITLNLFRTDQFELNNLSNDNKITLLSFFAALFFLCHPIQTQAVTYVVQRFTSLATFFFLCTILTYLKARHAKTSAGQYSSLCVSLVFTVLAMKTKEFSMTLPLVLILLEYTFFTGTIGQRLRFLAPFLLTLAIIPLTLYFSAPSAGDGIDSVSFEFGSSPDFTRYEYFLTQLTVIISYLRLLLIPINQNLDYDRPLVHSFFNFGVVGASILLILILIFGIYLWRLAKRDQNSQPALQVGSFGIFWFFITLSAESSFIKIKDLMFEHRLYLPSVGFFIAVVALVSVLINRFAIGREKRVASIFISLGLCVGLLFAIATHFRNRIWQDEILLWQDTVSKSPNKPRPRNNLALAYSEQGRYEEALQENDFSLQLKPDPGVHLNIGNIFLKQNRIDESIVAFQAAAELNPKYEKAYNGLCNAFYRQKRYAEAQQACTSAIGLNRNYAEAYNLLGLVYQSRGMSEESLGAFDHAIKIKPDFTIFHNNRANALYEYGNLVEALKEYGRVSRLDPSYLGAYLSIGKVYRDLGKISDAMSAYKTALKFKPDYREALDLLQDAQGTAPN